MGGRLSLRDGNDVRPTVKLLEKSSLFPFSAAGEGTQVRLWLTGTRFLVPEGA